MTLPTELANAIRDLGQRFNPEVAKITRELARPLHDAAAIDRLPVIRDITYGPDARHRLDIFGAGSPDKCRPVVIYVHGGGFVAGDKSAADGAPFYENVALWALAGGMACINMTYRLAPDHRWPAGSQDVAAVVAWLHAEGAAHGLAADKAILIGQSAGAVHVATYLAHPELHRVAGGGVAAAVLLSGLYDMTAAADNGPKQAYFGTDSSQFASQSALPGLIDHCKVPLFVGICELDPPDFQHQALLLLNALFARDGRLPVTSFQAGHNHLSSIFLLGSSADTLGKPLAQFISNVLAQG